MKDFEEIFKDFKESNIQFVKEQFDKQKCINPFIVLLIRRKDTYENMYLAIPNLFFENDLTKHTLNNLIIKLIQKKQPVAILFTFEGWMVKFHEGHDKELQKEILSGNKPISEMGDKGEAIIMNFESPVSGITIFIEIERDGDKVILKEPKEINEYQGRFAKYLNKIQPN